MAMTRRVRKGWWIRWKEGALLMGAGEGILCCGLSACGWMSAKECLTGLSWLGDTRLLLRVRE